MQLCGRQMAGVETAIHSVRELFVHDDCDAVLMVVLEQNSGFAQCVCPTFATILINVY